MIIRVCTIAFGDKYLSLEGNSFKPSLSWDIESLKAEGYQVDYNVYGGFREFIDKEGAFSMRYKDSACFFGAADTVWGKGSLYNLSKLIEGLNCHIAVPHFRVNDGFRVPLPMDSKELLEKALGAPHGTFTGSFDKLPENECHHGIAVRKLSERHYTMRHNLPTICMSRFNESDIQYFVSCGYRMGQWDRGFLDKLVEENRLKVVGSSDIAFNVEQTKPELINDRRPNNFDDKYHQGRKSNDVCRTFVYSMKY